MLGKKIFAVFAFVLLFSFSAHCISENDISAKSAVVLNCDTMETVFKKNAYQKLSMASTTKIMTSLLACESGKLEQTVNITAQMCKAEGTSVGLRAGNSLTLYSLVCGMMLESGNDAANATAIFLGGSMENFALMMNRKAKEIGMTNTNFVTPSGLDSENHYTTAHDMALLGAFAMKNETLREISLLKTKKVDFIDPDITLTFSNHNRLLRSFEGVYGIKTGFTKKSGRCLVSACERNGADFVCVTLCAPDDWNDHKKLLQYAFDNAEKEEPAIEIPNQITVIGAVEDSVDIALSESDLSFFKSADGEVTQKILLPRFVYAPIKSGDALGQVKIYYNGKLIRTADIIAKRSCEACEPSYKKRFSLFEFLKNITHHS